MPMARRPTPRADLPPTTPAGAPRLADRLRGRRRIRPLPRATAHRRTRAGRPRLRSPPLSARARVPPALGRTPESPASRRADARGSRATDLGALRAGPTARGWRRLRPPPRHRSPRSAYPSYPCRASAVVLTRPRDDRATRIRVQRAWVRTPRPPHSGTTTAPPYRSSVPGPRTVSPTTTRQNLLARHLISRARRRDADRNIQGVF